MGSEYANDKKNDEIALLRRNADNLLALSEEQRKEIVFLRVRIGGMEEALKGVLRVAERSDVWWIDSPDRGGIDTDAISNILAANHWRGEI